MTRSFDQFTSFNHNHQDILLTFVRRTITAHIRTLLPPDFHSDDVIFENKWGAFVTINQDGDLRGCMGRLESTKPLFETIREISISAATEDPRFFPMREEDLSNSKIKISLLSPLNRVASIDAIEVGKHGVVIDHARRRGVLLPQVPVEQGWGEEEFLQNVCIKAGLPEDTWKKKAKIFTFTTIEFGE